MRKGTQIKSNDTAETDKAESSSFWSEFRWILTKPISALWALIVGLVISLAPITYQDFLSSPKLEGKIVALSNGFIRDNIDSTDHRIYTAFLTISNQRNKPTTIVDFKLKLTDSNGMEKVYDPYYINSGFFKMDFQNQSLILKNTKYLLNEIGTLVTIEKPLSGFIYFDADKDIFNIWESAEIELIDGIGERHTIETEVNELANPELVRFLLKDVEVSDMQQ